MLLAGSFESEEAAQGALRALLEHRYDASRIRLLRTSPKRRAVLLPAAARGALFGAGLGAILGATLIVAMTLGTAPWSLGAWVILETLLKGILASALVGGSYGAAIGVGYRRQLAALRPDEGIWLGVSADGRDLVAEATLLGAGARKVVRVRGR